MKVWYTFTTVTVCIIIVTVYPSVTWMTVNFSFKWVLVNRSKQVKNFSV